MDKTLKSLIRSQVMAYTPCVRLPTGSLSFDLACGVNDGVGGLPRGLFTELWGDTGTGKSTLALLACARASKIGSVLYFDTERKLSHEWAAALGCRVGENFELLWPEDGPQALNDIINILDHNDVANVSLIVLDSIGGLDPKGRQYTDKNQKEREDFREQNMARLSRLLTPFFEQSRPTIAASGCAVLMVNHVRQVIGGYGGQYAPGGTAKDLASALEIRTLASTDIEKTVGGEKTLVGRYLNAKTKKNQTAYHPRAIKTPIRFAPHPHVDASAEVHWCGVEYNVIVNEDGKPPTGQQMAYFGDVALGAGANRSATYLDTHPDTRAAITAKLLDALKVKVPNNKLTEEV
jgi:recombination protein RecA